MLLNLASCQKCKGGLVREGDEWRCLQCGTYYYLKAQQPQEAIYPRKTWSINAAIQATQASEARWQFSNREIIEQLSAGSTTQDIASLTNHSPRRIQSVKERLRQAL